MSSGFETEHPATQESSATETTGPSVVVIHQSSSNWWSLTFPPALILLGALAITSHQLRPDPALYSPIPSQTSTGPRVEARPTPSVDAGTLEVRVVSADETSDELRVEGTRPDTTQPETGPPTEVTVQAVPLKETEWPEPSVDTAAEPVAMAPEPILDIGNPDPNAVQAAGVEEDLPLDHAPDLPETHSEEPRQAQAEVAHAEIVWGDIQEEADQARREREEMDAMRGARFAEAQEDSLEQLKRARLVAASDRGQFLSDLSQLVRKHGRDAGPYIAELLTLYGRNTHPDIQEAATRAKMQLEAASTAVDRCVVAYRRIGLPETCILDDLAQKYERTIGTRKGPRDRGEVLYFAARKLLAVPLDSQSTQAKEAEFGFAAPRR